MVAVIHTECKLSQALHIDMLLAEDIQYISMYLCPLNSSSSVCFNARSPCIIYSVVKMDANLTENVKVPFLLGGSNFPVRRTHAQPSIILLRR